MQRGSKGNTIEANDEGEYDEAERGAVGDKKSKLRAVGVGRSCGAARA